MQFLHLATKLYTRPHLISREGFAVIDKVFRARLNVQDGGPIVLQSPTEDSGSYLNPTDIPARENGIALISINGILANNVSGIDALCGGLTDISLIRSEIELAATNPDIATIALIVDSPGGEVQGIPELAQYIKEVNDNIKPIVAWVNGSASSAAYFLIAGVSEIYASMSSAIGSVGVYAYLLDDSKAFADEGLKPIVVRGGTEKGDLLPGLPITEAVIQRVQQDVDYIREMFVGFVKQTRGNIDDQYLQGWSYFAQRAEEIGFIDGIANSLSEIFDTETAALLNAP